MKERAHTGRSIAIVGGAGLLAWLLLRGGGGGGGGARGKGASGRASHGNAPARCAVWIRSNRIEVDGIAADLPTVVARCRAVGAASVRTTGDSITRVVHGVVHALSAAGVTLYTQPGLAYMASLEPPR